MIGYRFDIGCARCGGKLEHVNGSAACGTEAVAVARCTSCEVEWAVSVVLRRLASSEQQLAANRKRQQRAREKVSA